MRTIQLTRGLVAIVDECDAPMLSQHNWYAMKAKHTWYAARQEWLGNGKHRTIYMHRQLTGAERGQITDHENGNGIDNRRSNLRLCDQSHNNANQRRVSSANSSGIKGVSFHTSRNKWRAHIQVNGKFIHLGLFATKVDAATAYIEASRRFFGEFATSANVEQLQ